MKPIIPQSQSFTQTFQYSSQQKTDVQALKEDGQQKVSVSYSSSSSASVTLSAQSGSVEQSLTYSVESVRGASEVDEPAERTQAASNILNFISAQLQRDVADGATEEELASRLASGLEGFLKGFNEAYDQLADSGLLTPEVKEAVQQTYQNVLDGVDELAEKLGVESPVTDEMKSRFDGDAGTAEGETAAVLPEGQIDVNASVSAADQSAKDILAAAVANFESFREELQTRELVTRKEQEAEKAPSVSDRLLDSLNVSGLNYNSSEKRSFEFQLRTADGDVVTISMNASRDTAVNYADAEDGEGEGGQLGVSQSQSGDFLFEVKGDLDEDELKAINDLLSQVGDVSATFFEGDIFEAFEMALNIGFDSEEIAGFSLNLRREVSTQVEFTYGQVAQYSPVNGGETEKPLSVEDRKLSQLSDFIKMLEEVRLKAEEAGVDRDQLPGMAEFMAEEKHKDDPRFGQLRAFLENTLNSLQKHSES